jgi:hypothetical protein
VRLFRGYGDLQASIPLDQYTYVEFDTKDFKLRLSVKHGKLEVHADVIGETLKVLPRVANQVHIEVSR